MVRGEAIGPAVSRWAEREPSVRALVLIGSRVHAMESSAVAADEFSDWDFQVVTSRPGLFATRAWVGALGLGEPLAYVTRLGRLGAATKISAVLPAGEIDLIVIPAGRLRWVRLLVQAGLAARLPRLRVRPGLGPGHGDDGGGGIRGFHDHGPHAADAASGRLAGPGDHR